MSAFEVVLQVVSAFLGVIAVGVTVQVPKKNLILAGITGAAGWCVELLLENTILSAFLAALAVAVLAQIFARISKTPVTVYLITGIFPLVPGVGMYRTVYYLLQSNREQTAHYLTYTLQIAGMIALAIFVVDSFFKKLYRKRN